MNDECAKTLLPLLGGEGRGEGGLSVRGSWKGFPPGAKVYQLQPGHWRSPDNLGHAGVVDFKRGQPGQGPFEQNGQEHANNASMAENGNLVAAMLGQNFAQARFDPGAKCPRALGV